MAWGTKTDPTEPAGPGDPAPPGDAFADSTGTAAAAAEPARRHRGRSALRSVLCVILAVLGVLCLTLAPLVVWGRNLVLNTDRYVQTMEPLASNPGLQNAIVAAVDRQVESNLDVKGYLAGVLPSGAAQALVAPIGNAVNGLVNQVTTNFVQSKAFHTLWVSMNRIAHQQIVNLLTGKQAANGALKLQSGKVYLDLSQVVDNVKDRLVAAGVGVASKVPAVGATLEIAHVQGLTKAQRAVRALNTIADWLPWIGLALVAAAVGLAHRRHRALAATALGAAAGMGLIGVGLLIGRHIYLSEIPTTVLPRDTAASLFDTLVRFLRLGIRLLFLFALLVAVVAWVTGPSRHAAAFRAWASRATGRWRSGRVGAFVGNYATALRIGIVGLGLVLLLLSDSASWAALIVVGAVVLVLLGAVQVLRAPSPVPSEA